jgi:DNA replication protein DnaC
LGNPGVSKTHLATALGIEAAKKRNSVYFISCNDLITNLSNAFKENRLESKIKFYCKYRLLIIDEIGYLPITKDEANMFFQLIAKRYENKPTIITKNQPFSKWGEVFGDTTIAAAIIDRPVHHSIIMNIKGKSYRIKDLVQEDFNEEKKVAKSYKLTLPKTYKTFYQKPTKNIDIYNPYSYPYPRMSLIIIRFQFDYILIFI